MDICSGADKSFHEAVAEEMSSNITFLWYCWVITISLSKEKMSTYYLHLQQGRGDRSKQTGNGEYGRKEGVGRMKAHNPLEKHNRSQKSTTKNRIEQIPPLKK